MNGAVMLTVVGSSRGSSISASRKNTLPRQTLQSIRSNVGIRSRLITPATNLQSQCILQYSDKLLMDRILGGNDIGYYDLDHIKDSPKPQWGPTPSLTGIQQR